jgi:hypothetical protein
MKFYLPDWEDRVDPLFDFQNDTYSTGHKKNPYSNDIYAHQLYDGKSPYDGILVSISNFESKISLKDMENGKFTIRGISKIRDYLKIKKYSRIKIMGDCGAFSYVAREKPPSFYSVERVAGIYEALSFDFGVSVDHIAVNSYLVKENGIRRYVPLSDKEKDKRVKLTLRNASVFKQIVEERKYKFNPIGVAQGYDKKTYLSSVLKLEDMGYDYIALGGLVQYSNQELMKIIMSVSPYLEETKLHLFGVLRPTQLNRFESLGVTSFDSASYFRKAWLRSGQNYLSPRGKWFAAIRIPYSWNKNLLQAAKEENISFDRIKDLESSALNAIRMYGLRNIDLETALNSIVNYDRLLFRSSKEERNLEDKYRKTLKYRPWESCSCKVCKDLGVEVLIFRGANRNKRRGFHNTWIFQNKIGKRV